jgi:protein-histidine pros-kinase
LELVPEEFSLKEVIGEVASVLEPAARKKCIRLMSEIGPRADTVKLDKQRVKQILYNLLSNAVKFTDDEGQVRVTTSAGGPGEVLLKVRDSGIGIRPEDLGNLFVEFQQLEGGRGRRYPGTGLGLALTKRLVVLLQGQISVESAPGKGSTFTVTLPAQLEGSVHHV